MSKPLVVAGVVLVDEGQFDRLVGRRLHGLGQDRDLVAFLFVRGGEMQGQQMSSHINIPVYIRSVVTLVAVAAGPAAAFGGGLDGVDPTVLS